MDNTWTFEKKVGIIKNTWTFKVGFDILKNAWTFYKVHGIIKEKGGIAMPYAIDLFCGAGGFSEGLIQAGFHIVYSSDISPEVELTYRHRHEQLGLIQGYNTHFERADIRDITGQNIRAAIDELTYFRENNIHIEIDAMFGGPPCQGFSRAGLRRQDDPRNLLFGEYVRVINEVRPRYVVMENVVGFTDMEFNGFVSVNGEVYPNGTVTPVILRTELERIGYHTLEPRILNAAEYGVPQRRNRIIFIAYRDGEVVPTYPAPTHTPENFVTIDEAISDLIINEDIRNQYQRTEYQEQSRNGRTPSLVTGVPIPCENLMNGEISAHSQIIQERFDLYRQGEATSDLRKRIVEEGIDIQNCPNLIQLCVNELGMNENTIIDRFLRADVNEDMINVLLTKKGIRTRLHGQSPSATVVTIPDDYISPYEPRTFSVRELARLQSFDDSFEFKGKRTTGGPRRRIEVPQCSQVGNAVPPLLARAIATEIIRVLDR